MPTIDDITDEVLAFWFQHDYMSFFRDSEKYDTVIKTKFGHILQLPTLHYLPWYTNKRTFLCYILLLDQFPRHIYRYTPKAYACDPTAVRFLKRYYKQFLHNLKPVEQLFALLPLQHSEHIKDQQLGVRIITQLLHQNPNNIILKDILYHQTEHLNVIRTFHRFPKRNKNLHRVSTPAEVTYIKNSDPSKPY